MSVEKCAELAKAFVDRFNERKEDADIYAPDATVWNNLTGTHQPHASVAEITKMLQAALPDLRFDDASANAWADGFCVQYTVAATLADGTEVRASACGVASVRDGRITRFQEYVDSEQVAPLGLALAGIAREE